MENEKKRTSSSKNNFVNVKISPPPTAPRTFGQKASDTLTNWMGSWFFIIFFFLILIIWMAINAYYLQTYLSKDAFDPYPFILLNLVLSCLAAIQAPIIMMSQNRQAQKDRIRTEYDYAINRKSEREIQQIRKLVNRIERKMNG